MEVSRREFLTRAGAAGVALGSGALLDACSSNSATKTSKQVSGGSPKRGGTLVFARTQEAETLNPILAADNGSIWTITQIFDQLLEARHGYQDPQPGLAESWTSSGDGLTWTFHIRDAAFSDGSPVTAEDVKFTLDRFANPNINKNYAFLGSSIASTTVAGSRAVTVKLKHVDSTFLFNLAQFVSSVVPKAAVTDMGEQAFGKHPIGSAAFRLKSWTRGVSLMLERNPHYWRTGRPYVDAVTFNTVPNDNTRVLALQSGQAHIADAIPYPEISRLNATANSRVLSESISTWNCITLNNAVKPFNDLAVRQALNYATPRENILRTIYLGKAQLANSQVGKVKYWDPSVPTYPYDPGRAQALLKGSSASGGFSFPMITVSGDTVSLSTAQILQSAWAQHGIKVTIDQVDIGTALSQWYSNQKPAMLFPGNALSSDTLSTGENAAIFLDYDEGFKSFFTNYKSAQATKLINEVVGTLSQSKQTQLYAQIQRLGMHDTPTVAMFFTFANTGLSTKVHGFGTVPPGWWNLDEVWLD
jgi:peptide/nickel transport system substrate-binding protein